MIVFADVIVDLQYGDTGKGKVAHALAASDEYNVVLRYNGGSNAGHTVFHNGIKVVTHQVPLGVLFGKKSIIGPGCVVNINKLNAELAELNANGFNTKGLVFVDRRAHLVTDEHLVEDFNDKDIGTTKQGIGPAYRDKYARKGYRIGSFIQEGKAPKVGHLFDIIDTYYFLHKTEEKYRILCEGAQGFHLDIDWGQYPYVTSSHCTVGSACLNGIPPHKIRKVIGTMKAYETYVGNRNDYTDSENEVFKKIQEVGHEYGATTGRPRKVNWLNLDRVIQAIHINGATDVIINKADVLKQVDNFTFEYNNSTIVHETLEAFTNNVNILLNAECDSIHHIKWSMTPNGI